MKKIKFLNGFVVLLILLHTAGFVSNIYISEFSAKYKNAFNTDTYFGSYMVYIYLFLRIILIIGLIYIQRGLTIIIRNGFFNKRSSNSLKKAGFFFLISGVLNTIIHLIEYYPLGNIYLGQDFLILLIGFSLYIIDDIIDNGNTLKQENDLTI